MCLDSTLSGLFYFIGNCAFSACVHEFAKQISQECKALFFINKLSHEAWQHFMRRGTQMKLLLTQRAPYLIK